MKIKVLDVYVHPNQGQSAPKVWGGGTVGSEDVFFFGGADKGINVKRKVRGYVGTTSHEKLSDGYTYFCRIEDIAPEDVKDVVRSI